MSRVPAVNTDKIDAANATSPDLPAMCWSHGHCVRIKCPHTDAEVHSLVDEQRSQAATVSYYLGG